MAVLQKTPDLNSALYSGTVWHRRRQPREHAFAYQVFMLYLDLSELNQVMSLSRLWSSSRSRWARWALARFDRRDYFIHPGRPELDLDEAVREAINDDLGFRPAGSVCLLTNLRYFGYLTNPISVYYCFDETGERVDAILLEVTNTPWGEKQAYSLDTRASSGTEQSADFDKLMHVSPFMPMNMRYRWRSSTPSDTLEFLLSMFQQAGAGEQTASDQVEATPCFSAGVRFKRVPISEKSLNKVLIRFPLMTVKVITAIYWQALKLWWKGVGFVPHPRQRRTTVLAERSQPDA